MAETDDAYTLVSKYRHTMELVYADYANEMKNLGNKVRIEMVNTGKIPYSSTAKKTYAVEVKSLMDKLDNSDLNKIKERSAQRKANAEISTKKKHTLRQTAKNLKAKHLEN